MTKHLFLPLIALFFSSLALAQQPAAKEKSDPEAKKILDNIRKKYEGYKSFELAFTLTLEVPGQAQEVQKGTTAQAGNQFRLDMDDQVIVSDGKTTWVYVKKNNEVQINDAAPGDQSEFLTPKELLRRYQKGDFLYAITEKSTVGGKLLTHIEFKPVSRNSEYSKIRVSVDEKALTIESIKAFAKDGSRYTFKITRLSPNKTLPADHFSFDTKKYPGVRVEDLRM
ncbi:MAG: outer membrane lipoprotein carrier protein LolA [Saprospiraceae bacterium]|nr:outer membrane lipoprotein carrier protein LolA [Saprospiraceae bacterium]